METTGHGMYSAGPREEVVLDGSPFLLENSGSTPRMVLVALGTVTKIEFSVDGETWDDTGVVNGPFHLNPGHSLMITYISIPTVVQYAF